MPIYEYRCESCGHYLDALQKVSDEPLKECPECAGSLRRLISAPSFRLKGGGWYETDFKSDKERRRNLAEGAKGDSGSGDGASAQSKSDKSEKKSGDGSSGGSEKSGSAKSEPKGESKSTSKSSKSSGTEAA